MEPVVVEGGDMAALKHPIFAIDDEATRALVDRATELTQGKLPVKVATDAIGYSPTETMISLMGMEAVLFGVIDRPEFIHRLMEFITEGTNVYQLAREASSAVD